MGMMETYYSPTTMPFFLLRNMVTSMFIYADKSLLNFAEKHKLLEVIRHVLTTSFLFFLRLLPSYLFPSLHSEPNLYALSRPFHKDRSGVGDSGIARALSQLLSIVSDIPVSSRKYETVRSLAERVIEENRREDVECLREVNRTVLLAAFTRSLRQLEAAMSELSQERRVGFDDDGAGSGPVHYRLKRGLRAARSVGHGMWLWVRAGVDVNRTGTSAEKLAAELLWLAQKLAACGFVREAVEKWAAASKLARLSLSADPRLQGSLVKFSAFLFKQALDMGLEEETEEGNKENFRQTKVKMLTSWLPLLCRASNGTDAPVLSISERAEIEKLLAETIELLDQEEQEQVLSLWLHHFTYSSSSDWPNLHESYARWCTTSRRLLLLQ